MKSKLLPATLTTILTIILALTLCCNLAAQVPQTRVTPDCGPISFSLTATGTVQGPDNAGNGCVTWVVVYSSSGFSALSLALQSADDSSGSPGTWGTFSGTTDTGVNPNTAITQAYTQVTGYNRFIRINLTSVTGAGRVTGMYYGWKSAAGGAGGSSTSTVTCDTPGCVVIGPTSTGAAPATAPVYVAGRDGAGNVYPMEACTLSATFDTSTSGNTSLIALSGSTVIKVCHLSATSATSVDLKLTQGTGATCGTGTADLTGLYQGILAVAFDFGPMGSLVATAGNRVCLNLSAAVRTTGTIVYQQF